MSDQEIGGPNFMSDVAVRMIERDILAGDVTKLGLILTSVLDAIQPDGEDPESVQGFKLELLSLLLTALMYGTVTYLPSEEEQVTTFRDWLNDASAEFTQEEEPNGDS